MSYTWAVQEPIRPIVRAIDSPPYGLSKHLMTLLKPHVGNAEHLIRNPKHFIDIVKTINVKLSDIMVSFDVKRLFTKVSLQDTLEMLNPCF